MKLGDCMGFVEAVDESCTCGGAGPGEGCPACEVFHSVKHLEVEAPAQQPSEPAPGLDLAERNIRDGYVVVESQARAIADELDRLRAESADLRRQLEASERRYSEALQRPPAQPAPGLDCAVASVVGALSGSASAPERLALKRETGEALARAGHQGGDSRQLKEGTLRCTIQKSKQPPPHT